MDGFLPASSVTRRLSDIYSPIFLPASFLSLCESLLGRESEEVKGPVTAHPTGARLEPKINCRLCRIPVRKTAKALSSTLRSSTRALNKSSASTPSPQETQCKDF